VAQSEMNSFLVLYKVKPLCNYTITRYRIGSFQHADGVTDTTISSNF